MVIVKSAVPNLNVCFSLDIISHLNLLVPPQTMSSTNDDIFLALFSFQKKIPGSVELILAPSLNNSSLTRRYQYPRAFARL